MSSIGATFSQIIPTGAAIALLLGCSTSPDVVATSVPPDGIISSIPTFVTCKPGRYEGWMTALPGDGGPFVAFSGTISFKLVESLSGEFTELEKAAHLEGASKDDMSSFEAEIPSGLGCIEGKFSTKLENGKYFVNGATIPFDGPIDGEYKQDNSFSGKWTSYLHFLDRDLVVSGTWVALHAAEPN